MMDTPCYREFAPRSELLPFVDCVWTFSGPADPAPQSIAPDGKPELIVHLGAPYRERTPDGLLTQAQVLFAGQLTRPLTLVADGAVAVIGVRFRASAARAFLGVGADVATDRRLDLSPLDREGVRRLTETLHSVATIANKIDTVEEFVTGRMACARIDEEVAAHVEDMFAGRNSHHVGATRQWQRRFKAEVGVSCRMLRAIIRFRRVFDVIERPETSEWVGAALAAGYFDQPQMARDFRRFMGCTAREWATRKDGLARALTRKASVRYKTGSARPIIRTTEKQE
jgi:AraC-like DNA-binding protein